MTFSIEISISKLIIQPKRTVALKLPSLHTQNINQNLPCWAVFKDQKQKSGKNMTCIRVFVDQNISTESHNLKLMSFNQVANRTEILRRAETSSKTIKVKFLNIIK